MMYQQTIGGCIDGWMKNICLRILRFIAYMIFFYIFWIDNDINQNIDTDLEKGKLKRSKFDAHNWTECDNIG